MMLITPLSGEGAAPGGSGMAWVSVSSVAPGVGAVQADTGPLLATSRYDFLVHLMVSDTIAAGKGLVIEHRDAANAVTLATLGGAAPNDGAGPYALSSYAMAVNERLRVIAGPVAGAVGSLYVSAIGRRFAA